MHPNTARHIKIEAIRLNELDGIVRGAEGVDQRIAEDNSSFQEKLAVRTDYLAETLGIQQATEQLSSRLKLSGLFACCICIGLGFIAAGNAFDSQDSATVNFYWLILVLTGFNLLSMIVWCSALLFSYWMYSYRTDTATPNVCPNQSGTLFSIVKWLMNLMIRSKHAEIERSTLQAWIRVYSDSGLSRWALSRSSHLLWLCYLSGGLLMVLIMLSVREYNFGWATTILQPDTFIGLTQWLSIIPDALGLVTPDRDIVAASRLDTMLDSGIILDQQAVISARSSWATLLISSLLFYGMLPRFGLLILCHWKVKQAVQQYTPDYKQPYFLDLRQRLVPLTRSLGVIDPDDSVILQNPHLIDKPASNSLPEDGRFLSIELAADDAWPPANIKQQHYLGDANDSASQQLALITVSGLDKPLVCAVSLMASPDRGTARFLKELTAHCPTPVFLLIFGAFAAEHSAAHGLSVANDRFLANDSAAGSRLGDWHRLAAELNIPDSRLIHMQRHAKQTSA